MGESAGIASPYSILLTIASLGKGFHIIYSKTLLDLMARSAIELKGKEISLEKGNRKFS